MDHLAECAKRAGTIYDRRSNCTCGALDRKAKEVAEAAVAWAVWEGGAKHPWADYSHREREYAIRLAADHIAFMLALRNIPL